MVRTYKIVECENLDHTNLYSKYLDGRYLRPTYLEYQIRKMSSYFLSSLKLKIHYFINFVAPHSNLLKKNYKPSCLKIGYLLGMESDKLIICCYFKAYS